MFVIACRFDPQRPVIFDSVRSIRRFHPEAEILVVDSASPDKSYFPELSRLGATIADADNSNYEAGALWHAYTHYPREHYALLQDSVLLRSRLDDLFRHDVSGMMFTDGWSLCQKKHLDWGKAALANSDYPWLDDGFHMLFGCMLFSKREVLDRMARRRFDRVLPTDKTGSEAMERLFGIALQHEGYGARIPETFDSAWVGCTTNDGVQSSATPRLFKVWLGRQ